MDGARLKFLWDPWLNSSALHEELQAFREGRKDNGKEKDDSVGNEKKESNARRPTVILIGGGLWHARHFDDADAISQYQQVVDSIIATAYGEDSPISLKDPLANNENARNQIFFAPVIEPVYYRLTPSRESTIVPSKIDAMNGYLEDQSRHHGLNVLWSFNNMTRDRPETYGESGLHVIDGVSGSMVDVLLNLGCNAKAVRTQGCPYNRTCCVSYRSMNVKQILTVVCILISFIGLIFKTVRRRSAARGSRPYTYSQATDSEGSLGCMESPGAATATTMTTPQTNVKTIRSHPLFATLILLLCVTYCFLADRTHVFSKFSKQFSNLDFRLLLGLFIVVCLPHIKPIPITRDHRRPSSATRETTSCFLPREQADEFRGWMQLYVLIYAYTGSSSVLDFYEVNRVFLAFYLFLSGYGHAMYLLATDDYSATRVASVLFRRNILAVLLSIMMDRPYASYYFAPLVSFWFLVIYLTLRFYTRFNDSILFLLGKVLTSILLTTAFIRFPGILEIMVSVLNYAFRASLDVDEWRRYLGMDQYVGYVGVSVAILHIRISPILRTPRKRLAGFPRFVHRYFILLQVLTIGVAMITVPTFWILTRHLHNKTDYDQWVPYVVWLPVLTFVILRNATNFLRSYYCAAFAWIGRISLELYLLSQHIWLAGDGYGLLRVGFRGDGTLLADRWRDLVVLTPIFAWVASGAHSATCTLTDWVMSGEGDGQARRSLANGEENLGEELEALTGEPGQLISGPGIGERGLPNEGERSRRSSPKVAGKRRLFAIAAVIWILSLLG